MDSVQILSFALVALLLVISPGPNGVLIAKTVATSGKAAGFVNIAGFVVAFFLHGCLSILGISIILVQSAQAFMAIKILGAMYLCWMGGKALISAWQGKKEEPLGVQQGKKRNVVKAFAEGFITNALNPKVSIFYLAAFPQFMPIGTNGVSSAFLLVAVHAILNCLWFSAMVVLVNRFAERAIKPGLQRALKALTGGVFVGFGVKLALMRHAV